MVNYISSTIFGSHIITYDLWNYSPTKSLSRTLQQKKDHEPYVMVETPLKKTSPQIMFSIKILEIAFSHKQQTTLVGGHWEEALQLLHNMHEAKVHPNVAPWQLMQMAMVGDW